MLVFVLTLDRKVLVLVLVLVLEEKSSKKCIIH